MMVPSLELNEVGGFYQLEMKREILEAWTTDHNQTHSSKQDMDGGVAEHLIEPMN